MPFLPPNQQCQNSKQCHTLWDIRDVPEGVSYVRFRFQDITLHYMYKESSVLQCNWQEAYEEAVRSFADLTTASAALYHKVAQLLLIENSGNPLLSYKFRALSLVR